MTRYRLDINWWQHIRKGCVRHTSIRIIHCTWGFNCNLVSIQSVLMLSKWRHYHTLMLIAMKSMGNIMIKQSHGCRIFFSLPVNDWPILIYIFMYVLMWIAICGYATTVLCIIHNAVIRHWSVAAVLREIPNYIWILFYHLTHWGLVTPYCVGYLGRHWFR